MALYTALEDTNGISETVRKVPPSWDGNSRKSHLTGPTWTQYDTVISFFFPRAHIIEHI